MIRKLLFSALACLGIFYAQSQAAPKREFRGAWIATYANIDWPNRSQTPAQQQAAFITLVDHHKATGINALFIQIRSQCDALYPSSIEPWSADLTGTQGKAPNPVWDPMQFMIDECHKRGIEFHAWINPYRAVANATQLPSFAPSHVAKQHPEWLLSAGSVRTLDPGLPAVRNYIVSVITDIVQRYDLDGIHFDDYFYPSGTFNDDASYNADPRGFTVRADWRRDNVNLLIKRVNETVISLKPWVKFGVSPSGIYRNSTNPEIGSATSGLEHYSAVYADTRKWLQQGWLDYLCPQLYWYIGQPGANYGVLVPWWNNNTYGRHMYIGMAGYKVGDAAQAINWQDPKQIPNEVRMNRSYANISGEGTYNTSSLRANKLGFRDSLRLSFYAKPALLPTMPWRDATPPQPATLLSAVKYKNDSVVLNWTKPPTATSELDKVKKFVVYRSTLPQIDLQSADNIVTITPNDTTAFADKTIVPGVTYYYTVTALDRFQNESINTNAANNLPPQISCPADQELVLNTSCAALMPDYTTMASVTNNGNPITNVTVTQTPLSGTVLQGTGNTVVTLTATDKGGNFTTCSFTVHAKDVTAPVISDAATNVVTLTPPNHKMRKVTVNYNATDNCGAVTTALTITSNEPQDGLGDGDTEQDWEVIDAHHVKLRAERSGTGEGRVYTILITATDASGNTSTQTLTVSVPHSNAAQTSVGTSHNVSEQPNQNALDVKALQNPTAHAFVLVTQSASDKLISLKVTDNAGRVIEQRNNLTANGTLYLKGNYGPGIYYAEIIQGDVRKTIKLVKQAD